MEMNSHDFRRACGTPVSAECGLRQWSYIVKKEEAGMSLEQILRRHGFSKREISRQKFLSQGILLDGEKCRVTELVRPGMKITLNFQERLQRAEYVAGALHEACTGGALDEIPEYGSQANSLPDAGKSGSKTEILPNADKFGWQTEELPGTAWLCQKKRSWKLLYEDAVLLVVDKPSGLSCHPGRGHYYDNLGSQVLAYCQEKGEQFPVRAIGRLDKDTSGIVVFAKNQWCAARLWKQREDGRLRKTYYVLVHGQLPEVQGTIDVPIYGRKAITRYRVLDAGKLWKNDQEEYINVDKSVQPESQPDCKLRRMEEAFGVSLIECTLETGRTHQIRIHMSHIGHPVAGDPLYGQPDGFPRLCLHAGRLQLTSPLTGEVMCFATD